MPPPTCACTATSYGDDDDDEDDEDDEDDDEGLPWMVMADAAAAAVVLILARRAWAVVVRDNDRGDNGEGGDPPALSFHSAAVWHPVKRRALIWSREVCLDEAVAWEDLVGHRDPCPRCNVEYSRRDSPGSLSSDRSGHLA